MGKRVLTDKQVAFVKEGTSAVNPKNAWNYEQRVQENVNESLLQLLQLFPELLPYLDADRIQDEFDPTAMGIALGELLTREQYRTLAAMLIWGEQRPDESTQEFLARVPELIEAYEDEFARELARLERAGDHLDFLRAIAERLETKFETHIDRRRDADDVTMAVPVERVLTWGRNQRESEGPSTLPDLLDELYPPWEEGGEGKLFTCRTILMSLGMRLDVESVRPGPDDTIEEQWRLHIPPTETDTDQYVAVIDALDDDIQELVARFFEAKRIVQKDLVLEEAVDVLDGLSKPARDLLEEDDPRTANPDWKGHHTRTANRWSNDREIPLLTVSHDTRDRHAWEWTALGELVRALWKHNIDRTDLKRHGVPDAIETEVIESAVTAHENRDS